MIVNAPGDTYPRGMTENRDDLIRIPEVAAILKVSVRTVFRMLARGKLVGHKQHGQQGRPVLVSRAQAHAVARVRFLTLYGPRRDAE